MSPCFDSKEQKRKERKKKKKGFVHDAESWGKGAKLPRLRGTKLVLIQQCVLEHVSVEISLSGCGCHSYLNDNKR